MAREIPITIARDLIIKNSPLEDLSQILTLIGVRISSPDSLDLCFWLDSFSV